MQKGAQRTCTVKACFDDTNLMEINKSSFDDFVGEYKTESVKTIINFYKSCSLFKTLSDQKKVELSAKSFMIKYPSNTVIVRQGDVPYNVYFIAAGSVRLVRRVALSPATEPLSLDTGRPLDPTLARPTDPAQARLFQVGLLEEGDSFADWELFHGQPVTDSVVTTVPTLIIYVPYFWIVERLGPNDLARIRENSKAKVSNALVLKCYQENAQWNSFKHSLVQNLMFEKHNRLAKMGKPTKMITSKVDINSKTREIARLVEPPNNIGVRITKILKTNSSSSRFPPIIRSKAK